MKEGVETSRLVVFDVCDTLYDANTTVDFVRFYGTQQASGTINAVLRRWLDRQSPFFYFGAAAQRLVGWDIARHRIIASLAGEPRTKLTEAAVRYVRDVLPASANREIHQRLEAHRAAGDCILLLSSSLDFVVARIAEQLHATFRASTLEFDNDVCSGRLSLDLSGRKAECLSDQADSKPETWVYTDNRSDKDLISLADRVTIVIPRGKREKRWAGDGCEYVRL